MSSICNNISGVLTLVQKELSKNSKYKEIVDHGDLEVNCFSLSFWIDFKGSNGRTSVYVKIPKIIFYDKNKENILPLSEKDKVLAQGEYQSLVYLLNHWDSSLGVNFVKPLGYIKEYNAIITERIEEKFFFKYCRLNDLVRKLTYYNFDRISEYMYMFGISLKAFHKQDLHPSTFNFNYMKEKFRDYISTLQNYNVSRGYLVNILKNILGIDYKCRTQLVNNLKGIDVRQIFIDTKNNKLHVIDPGKITKGYAENDIARYIVTTRILYWGTMGVFLNFTPHSSFEENFLYGYYGCENYSNKMLTILIVKELFKHWIMAHQSLNQRPWKNRIKVFLRKYYIDRFYIKLMNYELSKL